MMIKKKKIKKKFKKYALVRICKHCGEKKDVASGYYKTVLSYCIECVKKQSRLQQITEKYQEYIKENSPKRNEYYKKWYLKNGRKRISAPPTLPIPERAEQKKIKTKEREIRKIEEKRISEVWV